MKISAAISLSVALMLQGCARAEPGENIPGWAVGYWVQVHDDDGRPGDDTLEIRSDGTAVSYDSICRASPAGAMHVHDGVFYVTWLARKGPIALAYVPSVDHKQITFTSPRTGNNAVYERAAGCTPAEA